ncbi:MAG: hypothetical protein WCA16_18370 [Candidatus Sulfotelmatobacter sp.]
MFVFLRRGGGHEIIDRVVVFIIDMNDLRLQQFAIRTADPDHLALVSP